MNAINQVIFQRDTYKVISLLEKQGVDLATVLSDPNPEFKPVPPELSEKLDAMKKDLGAETFEMIAAGDSMSEMIELWEADRWRHNCAALAATVRTKLGTSSKQVNDREIASFLQAVSFACSEMPQTK